jgi:rhomboid protease GluP
MPTCTGCGQPLNQPDPASNEVTCPACGTRTVVLSPALRAALAKPTSRFRTFAQRMPEPMLVTVILVAINIVVYVVMVARGVSPWWPEMNQLIPWGVNYAPLTLADQPWRILTCNYVHVGLLHLALNMWCLWNLGHLAERIFGRWTFLATYTLCGIAGSLATLWWHPLGASAGASGAIFGLAGALITAIYLGKLPYSHAALRSLGRSLLSFAGYNLLIGFLLPIVDNAAHIGGLVMGLAIGALAAPWLPEPSKVRRFTAELVLFGSMALILTGLGKMVWRVSGYVVPMTRGPQELMHSELDRAIPDLEAAAQRQPGNVGVLRMLGVGYLRKGEYEKAAAAFEQITHLLPDDLSAQYDLGLAYGAAGDHEKARQVFARLTHLDPGADEYWLLLGSSLRQLKRWDEAEVALEHAAQINPSNAAALRELGWLRLDRDQPEAALEQFKAALRFEPDDAEAEFGLARAYAAMDLQNQAADAMKRYQELKAQGAKKSAAPSQPGPTSQPAPQQASPLPGASNP